MRNFQIFRYLKSRISLIVAFFLVMTGLSYYVLFSMQQYVASAVIRYNNEDAVQGYAPDGSKIDVSEIGSADNLAKVMENLGLGTDKYSVDSLCTSISVSPVYEEETQVIKEALNEGGERYEEEPVDYLITCSMGREADENLVRNILNELLDVYFSKYSSEHINEQQISNQVKGIKVQNLDYLEAVEKIGLELELTIDKLRNYIDWDSDFRSSKTGYSFMNLQKEFILLHDVNLYRLYSLILGNKVTKDEELLVNRYENEIADYRLTGLKAQDDVNQSDRIIDAYVEKLRDSGNSNINYNYILDEVYDEWNESKETTESDGSVKTVYSRVDRSVEYDTLLTNWVKARDEYDYSTVDRAYCEYILGVYQGEQSDRNLTETAMETEENSDQETGAEENTSQNAEAGSHEVAVPDAVVVSKPSDEEEIETEIRTILERMNRLYEIADITNTEYNEYLGAKNIRTLTSVSTTQTINMKVWMAVISVVFLLMGCCGAVLIGRIGDILEYVFLRDHQTGCMNRVSCDNYISRQARLVMSAGFCCVNLQLQNQREINNDLGREEADKILAQFGQTLREMYENQLHSFVGYNGSGQFWVFYENDMEKHMESEMERLTVVLKDLFSFYPVTYALSGVNAGEAGDYQIRSLISKTVSSRKTYTTVVQRDEGEEKSAESD